MNLEKISEGMVVANYPKMCELLDEKTFNGGKSKKLQLERWRKYFDWINEGHKFVITKVREHPLPKPIYKNDLYTKKVLNIIHKELLKENHKEFYTSKELLYMCGFINHNYYNIERGKKLDEFKKEYSIGYNQLKYLFNKLDEHKKSYSLRKLERSLSKLSERKYIVFERVYIIKHFTDKTSRRATLNEEELYEHIYNKAKKKLNIDYVNTYTERKLYKEVNTQLSVIGIEYCYKAYRIDLGLNSNEIDNIITEDTSESIKFINKMICEKMFEYADIEAKKDIEKLTNQKFNVDDDLEPFIDLQWHKNKEIKQIEFAKVVKGFLIDYFIKIEFKNDDNDENFEWATNLLL